MAEQKIRARMDEAARESREKFFKVADMLHLQPKYQDRLAEIEELKQWWRDMPTLPDYPNIDFPPKLPDWFPAVESAGCWQKDIYIKQELKHYEELEKLKDELK